MHKSGDVEMRAAEVDLIQEFRLRKWAREHYVPAAGRNRQWHPIVLEEMEFRDEELAAERIVTEMSCRSFVPLEPAETYYLDDPHPVVPPPKSLAASNSPSRIGI
jgi:hypothetical protein